MRLSDYFEHSFSNLWKTKIRTFLTIFGVVIAIGALVSMISFGKGMQKNITEEFNTLELFNYITVFADPFDSKSNEAEQSEIKEEKEEKTKNILDEKTIEKIKKFKGVELVFPEIRFPGAVRFNENEEFTLIQVLPTEVTTSKMMKLRAGKSYFSDDENSLIVSDTLLHRLAVKIPSSAIGKKIEVSTITFDFSLQNLLELPSMLQKGKLPFSKESYEFTVVGITERMGFGGPSLLRSNVFIPPGTSDRMKKLPITNLWDLIRSPKGRSGYSMITVRVSSPKFIEPVKAEIKKMDFRTFALTDELEEIRTGFLFMDMFLAAVGMIAIVVASLGIINTMVMSILERYSEIGIMKAVGASDRDIKKIFFFESSAIGFLGGVLGLGLGWIVSKVINRVVNYFLAKQGVPFIEYFSFPWWLCLGAIVFAVLVSLVSGIYPTLRAARVDPVVALRHD